MKNRNIEIVRLVTQLLLTTLSCQLFSTRTALLALTPKPTWIDIAVTSFWAVATVLWGCLSYSTFKRGFRNGGE